LTISIIVGVLFSLIAVLITAFEPRLTAMSLRPAVLRTKIVPSAEVVVAKRGRLRRRR
jgi:hypothetical protein